MQVPWLVVSMLLCAFLVIEKNPFLVVMKNYADVLWKASCEPGFRGIFLLGTFSWVLAFLELFTPFLLLVAGL
jgi:hypothetical protein